MLTAKNITYSYGSKMILERVSFSLQEGKISTFMGTSGAGKTTLLKCAAHLHSTYEGNITFDGVEVRSFTPVERAAVVGYVHQQYHLFPHLTVLKNCTYALKGDCGDPIALLKKLGMGEYLHVYPRELSGGQQQRVAIARALVLKPKVLLLDEPTAALDPDSKRGLKQVLEELVADGFTLALSSHDLPFIKEVSDRIYFLEGGKLIEEWECKKGDLALYPKIHRFLS